MIHYSHSLIVKSFILVICTLQMSYSSAQCGSCTNPTGNVSVGFGQSICYDANTTVTNLQVFFDGVVTICDNVIITVTGATQLSGTAQIEMSNCSEIDMTGSFTCSSNNAFIYLGDSTCDARVTIHSPSTLCASLTEDSNVQFCNINSAPITGSTGSATVGCGLALPVELIKFEVFESNEEVLIEWATASEINNDYFTIERSVEGSKWQEIHRISGAGNSSVKLMYRKRDDWPLYGIAYYRLKQTDFDGKFKYFKTVAITRTKFQNKLHVYPNPTTHQLTVEGNKEERDNLKVYSILGTDISCQVMRNEDYETKTILNLSNLEPGTYYLKTNKSITAVYKQ